MLVHFDDKYNHPLEKIAPGIRTAAHVTIQAGKRAHENTHAECVRFYA